MALYEVICARELNIILWRVVFLPAKPHTLLTIVSEPQLFALEGINNCFGDLDAYPGLGPRAIPFGPFAVLLGPFLLWIRCRVRLGGLKSP